MTAPDVQTVDPEPVKPDPAEHQFPGVEPSFSTYMRGCRCPDCTKAHKSKSTAGGRPKGAKSKTTTKAPPQRASRASKAKAVARSVDVSLPEVIAAAGGKTTGRGAGATVADLQPYFGAIAVFALSQLAVWLVDGDETRAEDMTPTDDEVDSMLAPLIRLFAGSSINSKYGRSLVENSDILDAVITTFFVGQRYAEAIKVKTGRPNNAPQVRPETAEPVNNGNGIGGFIPGAHLLAD